MRTTAIYPGTFDPITNGHIDIIERASKLFDEVTVIIGTNLKKSSLFSKEERLQMALESTKHIENVGAKIFDGLTIDYAKEHDVSVIIRGIRAISDFEYEFQMALMNRKLMPNVTTLFMMPDEKYTYLNSSIIRELAGFGKDVSEFVPECVQARLIAKMGSI
jgi:pantetheine-phosphate adenylyltransferase